jgi:hypothetical protein
MNLPFSDKTARSERTVLHRPLPAPFGGPVHSPLLPVAAGQKDLPDSADKRRTKIWELGETLHCSIVGTCLSTAELRQVIMRAGIPGSDKVSEHELHMLGVLAAGRRDISGRLLQKALDRRHGGALAHFARMSDAQQLRAGWSEAVKNGDIPGAYWAVLTHPAATAEVVKFVFGEIHMLSHLVGAANRADIRRLRQLEDENAALQGKLARQQRHLQDALVVRDEAVRRLNDSISVLPAGAPEAAAQDDREAATKALIDDLNRRLLALEVHSRKQQERLATQTASLKQAQGAQRQAEAESAEMRGELELANARIADVLTPDPAAAGKSLDLSELALLYVGGRAHQVPSLRALVERSAGQFIHHDGGVDDNANLLPGLVSRADLVVFPVDCVSHGAVNTVKRLCSQTGKRLLPLRTASLTCLLAALSGERAPA